MLISSTMGSVEYAIGLLRSAQARVVTAGISLSTGNSGSDDPRILRELKIAKAEQKLALQMLESKQELDQSTVDMIAKKFGNLME